MPPSPTFEDRLLAELRHVVAGRPAPRGTTARRRLRRVGSGRVRIGLAGVAAATAAAVLVATSGDRPTRAYAVEKRHDGSVTVHIRSLRDADGLQSRLRAAGVPAVVNYQTQGRAGCAGPGPTTARAPGGAPPRAVAGSKVRHSTGPGLTKAGTPGPGQRVSTGVRVADDGGVTFTLDPGHLDAGQKVYVTTSGGSVGSVGVGIGGRGPGVPCPAP